MEFFKSMDFTLKNKGHRLVEKGFECEKRIVAY